MKVRDTISHARARRGPACARLKESMQAVPNARSSARTRRLSLAGLLPVLVALGFSTAFVTQLVPSGLAAQVAASNGNKDSHGAGAPQRTPLQLERQRCSVPAPFGGDAVVLTSSREWRHSYASFVCSRRGAHPVLTRPGRPSQGRAPPSFHA